MSHWLLKTEPEAFSLEDLRLRQTEPWDGIRNYQARNFLRAMQIGEEVFIYHSRVPEPGIVGVAVVASKARPDPTQFDPQSKYFDPRSRPEAPRWDLVDISYVGKLARVLTLEELRQFPEFSTSQLIRKGNRLSILPIDDAQWHAVLSRVPLV